MRFALGLALLLAVSAAHAEDVKDLAGARKVADTAMELVGKGDVRGGLSALKRYSALPDADFEVTISSAQNQRTLVASQFGRTLAVVFVDQTVVGDCVVRLRYIEKFEKHMLRWQIYFYRPDKNWLFDTFLADDKIHALFD